MRGCFSNSPAVRRARGSRCAAPASCWPSPAGRARRTSRTECSAMPRRSGARVASMKRRAWPASSPTPRARGVPRRFPPLARARIVELACLEPVAKGLHLTHWSSADLARQAARDGVAPAISARTVRRILATVDLQPHRTRYWRTGRLDAEFKARAERVLWCYAHAERLAAAGFWV